MKYLFFIFLIVLTSCARSDTSLQWEQKEISPEEKIAQVQQLLDIDSVENTQSWDSISTQPMRTETKTQVTTSFEVLTWIITSENVWVQVSEPIVKEQNSESQEEPTQSLSTLDTQESNWDSETFTPDELDVIENTSDAEVDELIDIIFKE